MVARQKSKTGVRVARDLVEAIREKGLVPGDRYLSEADATTEHGVSRATYREATRFLEFQGVISTKAGPGGGTVVARPDWRNLTSTFALLMQFSGTSLAQVLVARRLLEPEMAAEAARNVTDEQIASLQRLAALAHEHVADVDRFISAYRTFWHLIADATANPVTAELWKSFRALTDSGRFVPNERFRSHLVGFLRDMLGAMEARDADRAREVIEILDAELTERLERDYPQRINKVMAWSDVTDHIEEYSQMIGDQKLPR